MGNGMHDKLFKDDENTNDKGKKEVWLSIILENGKIFRCLSERYKKTQRKVAKKFGRYRFLVYLCTRFHKDECLIASLAQLVRAHDC